MDWSAWAPTIVTVFTAFFIAGQVVGRIKDQEKTLLQHHNRLNTHETKIADHEVEIERAKAWREGYNAGKVTR